MAFRTCTFRTSLACFVACLFLAGLANRAGAEDPQPTYGKIEKKTYDFKEAGKEMEYALYVPSRYDKNQKTPLLVALHGLGGNPQQIMRSRGLTEQAEKHGYIVAAPMGYNSSGWYGANAPGGSGRTGGPGRTGGLAGPARPGGLSGLAGLGTPPGTVLSPRVQETLNLTDEQKQQLAELQQEVDGRIQKILSEGQSKQLKDLRESAGRGLGGLGGPGGGQDAPANLRELSEKDVLNVLDLVRREFNIDDRRIYLLGHSMGGAGVWHLGTKHPDLWAGLAPIAPAAFGQPTGLERIKHLPVIVVQGDQDTLVRPEGTRRWVARLKELDLTHEYLEIAGGGHGDVISKGMPQIFAFFEKQRAPADASK